MNNSIHRIIGTAGGQAHVVISNGPPLVTESLQLFVNGNGQLLALTDEQVRQRQSLSPSTDPGQQLREINHHKLAYQQQTLTDTDDPQPRTPEAS